MRSILDIGIGICSGSAEASMKLNAFILGMGMGLCCGGRTGGRGLVGSVAPSGSRAPRTTIAAGDCVSVQSGLKVALAGDPGNAGLRSLRADSIHKGANPDMALGRKHCHEALRIDPRHRGAQEYIGEAHLMTGNLSKAREHLAALDKICFFGCAEYDMLKKAIASREAKPWWPRLRPARGRAPKAAAGRPGRWRRAPRSIPRAR